MELNSELKQKLTERFLKSLQDSFIDEDICDSLLDGKHQIDVSFCKKYTIAEITFEHENYEHHFLGISARNPNDPENKNYGTKIAVEDGLRKLLTKFYLDNLESNLNSQWGSVL